MVKSVSIALAMMLSGFALSQSDPVVLGDTVPVDVHSAEVKWHPEGQAFLYIRQEETGKSIGAYALGKFEGKGLVKLGKNDTYQSYWLSGSKAALIVIHSPAPQAATKSTQIRMVLIDAENMTAKQNFSEIFDDKALPSVEVDTSPSLKHAIITLRGPQETRHMILALGFGEIVKSPDLDRAEKEGLTGPSWSVDGTAVYSNTPGGRNTFISKDVPVILSGVSTGGSSDQVSGGTFEVTLTNSSEAAATTVSGKLLRLSFRLSPPMPATNSPVFELIPTNGVLRPVRFRGPFESRYTGGQPLISRNQPVVLQFEKSNTQQNSVWVRRGTEKVGPSTFLGVNVSETALSPQKNAVAYVIDGALFVRTIK